MLIEEPSGQCLLLTWRRSAASLSFVSISSTETLRRLLSTWSNSNTMVTDSTQEGGLWKRLGLANAIQDEVA